MSRMCEYMSSSESNTIFTDDLKSALCLTESDADIDVTLQMLRRCVTRLCINSMTHASLFCVVQY